MSSTPPIPSKSPTIKALWKFLSQPISIPTILHRSIDLNDTEIRRRAHKIWKARVRTGKSGSPVEDWQRAIEELQVERQSTRIEKLWWMTGLPATKGLDRLTGIMIPIGVFGIVPIIAVLLTLWGSNQQQQIATKNREQDLQIADEKQKDEVLKNYFDSMKALLVDTDKFSTTSNKDSSIRGFARTLTLTTLRQLDNRYYYDPDAVVTVATDPSSDIRIFTKVTASTPLSTSSISVSIVGNARKGWVLQFLKDSNLIEKNSPIIDLNEANLRVANLNDADLHGINLSGANLSRAFLNKSDLNFSDLSEANLSSARVNRANLSRANLSRANLSSAKLTESNLSKAVLNRTNLSNVDLSGSVLNRTNMHEARLIKAELHESDLSNVNLSKAILLTTDLRSTRNLTQQQLEGSDAPLLCNVALPEELASKPNSVNPNRDCDRMAQRLVELYPKAFPNLQAAQRYVNQTKQEKWD